MKTKHLRPVILSYVLAMCALAANAQEQLPEKKEEKPKPTLGFFTVSAGLADFDGGKAGFTAGAGYSRYHSKHRLFGLQVEISYTAFTYNNKMALALVENRLVSGSVLAVATQHNRKGPSLHAGLGGELFAGSEGALGENPFTSNPVFMTSKLEAGIGIRDFFFRASYNVFPARMTYPGMLSLKVTAYLRTKAKTKKIATS